LTPRNGSTNQATLAQLGGDQDRLEEIERARAE
jgi:hypothetical protein